ncbi:ATP dependent RNA helicase [Grosmannia clavigera kw1407]|uniref:ATP-dependent RNA helicase n=1 Tax=Grosmannia clavigera (strain kw1407 / UAMH 11150) TaxID=655863 RepID=F0X934_GROCL|nr:ATP dependent RNA helicase [Grosmannia clavigera kw1407]EFX05366.1 ATP dependent RNA helicase [Grosmannia clavigera kw1407]
MAPLDSSKANKKRKYGKAAGGQPQKRRKGNFAKAKQPAAPLPRRVVAPGEIQWKAVAVPEMFADAEGFFGLEEVEGVDVVRSGNTFQFVTAGPPPAADDDEFEGFGDDSSVKPTGESNATQTDETDETAKDAKLAKKTKPKTTDKANGKKKGKAAAVTADPELVGGGFAMLADMDDDAEDATTDVSAWVPLDIVPPLLSCLARLKFSKPSAIQAATIPEILAGHDVIGKASTGSGKTLAFAIPIVQRWLAEGGAERRQKKTEADGDKDADGDTPKKRPVCRPTALVLSPTGELAHQITTHIKELCAALPSYPYVCAVTGGLSVFKQQRQLEKADIVVGTPGRLWEVLSTSKPLLEAFRSIDFLVVDEADRLLSDGHFKEAEEILEALDRTEVDEGEGKGEDEAEDENEAELETPPPKPRQTLVFSATFNRGLQQKLAGKSRYDLMDQKQSMDHLMKRLNFREESPQFIDVNPVSQMAERLREGMVECGAMEKDLYLYSLLLLQPTRRTLVFANSISTVRRLAPLLQNLNLPAIALHSQMPQKARLRAVERFKAAQGSRGAVLIATDVAARGLDIPGIDVVIHYHVPRSADNYVHRSGRTARAASAGLSILLCGPEEVVPTRRLVAKIHAAVSLREEGEGGEEEIKEEEEEEEKEEEEGVKKGKGKNKKNKGKKDKKDEKDKKDAKDKDGRGKKDGTDMTASKSRPNHNSKNLSFYIRTIDLDRRLVSRLKERLVLAKKLADAALAREKGSKDDSWMREAAEELGVEYDSQDDDLERASSWSGRGSGRRTREKESRDLSKADLGALRAELRDLLARRVNVGVSERYLTSGGINVDEMLRSSQGDFLGRTDSLGMEA